jgi:hypothetical protein
MPSSVDGAFHDPASGPVTVPFTYSGAVPIPLVTDLADGLRLRIDIRWDFEDDAVPDLVSFIDHITRTTA